MSDHNIDSAFPVVGPDVHPEGGLTKREYAAIQIFAALCARQPHPAEDAGDYVEMAVEYTDSLFEYLE